MLDRQPQDPGHIKLVLDAASAALLKVPAGTEIGAHLVRDDEPLVDGHRLNKYTLLKDITCGMLGLDPQVAVPDDALQMLAALASSGGSGSGDVGELEDLTIRVGKLTNAGAGWNTYRFPVPFDAAPQAVLTQPVAFSGWVEVKSVTADGFLYCLRTPIYTAGSVSTGAYYTANGTASSSAHSAQTLVNGVTLPTAQNKTTAEAIEILWVAIEFDGGDEEC